MPAHPTDGRGGDPTCDTSPAAAAVQVAIYRAMPAWRKIELVAELNKTARTLALAGLRRRHPNDSPQRLQRRLHGLILGEELATKAYGPLDAEPAP
jgi:hypothetical protein